MCTWDRWAYFLSISLKSDVYLLRARFLNLELRGYEKSSFRPSKFRAAFKYPIGYEHGDDNYVLRSGLMLEGWYSQPVNLSVNPPHYGRWCWHCLIIVWWRTTNFRSHSNQNFCLANPKTPTATRCSRSLVFAVCGVHGSIVYEHGWSCNGWLSRCGTAWVSRTSSKFRQGVMYALDLDQGQFATSVKVPEHHDGMVCVGMSSLATGRMEMLKGTFDALRVRPIGPTRRGYRALSFRGYQRFDQGLQLLYQPPKSLLHAIVGHRRNLLWLFGENTAIQTPRTLGIYEPRFRYYWLDYHKTMQKWIRGINFEV